MIKAPKPLLIRFGMSSGTDFAEVGHHGACDLFRHVLEDARGQFADEGLAVPQAQSGPPVK